VRRRRGGRAIIVGRLTTRAGRAVAGAQVTVLAADAERREQSSRTVGALRTDERGRFRAAIALDRGATRKLLGFSYLADGDDTAPAALARARLDVEAPIRLVAREPRARRGESVELAGRSAPAAAISLQVDAPDGHGWQTLASVRAGRDGRWRASVRVPPGAIGGRYRFRARVAGSRKQGYAAAATRPVTIEVR
jgi:5-hydroxyisourate hydrolase-like protein (transthyretin family)